VNCKYIPSTSVGEPALYFNIFPHTEGENEDILQAFLSIS
jgi:hypothetical protein